jgi:hypothetical protein
VCRNISNLCVKMTALWGMTACWFVTSHGRFGRFAASHFSLRRSRLATHRDVQGVIWYFYKVFDGVLLEHDAIFIGNQLRTFRRSFFASIFIILFGVLWRWTHCNPRKCWKLVSIQQGAIFQHTPTFQQQNFGTLKPPSDLFTFGAVSCQ